MIKLKKNTKKFLDLYFRIIFYGLAISLWILFSYFVIKAVIYGGDDGIVTLGFNLYDEMYLELFIIPMVSIFMIMFVVYDMKRIYGKKKGGRGKKISKH